MMFNHLATLTLGIAIGALMTTCLVYARVGRALGKLVSVLTIGSGVGLLTWGILITAGCDFKPLEFGPIVFTSAGQIIGWGAGLLSGGVTALVLAFVGAKLSV